MEDALSLEAVPTLRTTHPDIKSTLADRIALLRGDITRLQGDAIVNATNPEMSGGGGVDYAIHRAAGPGLKEECAKISGGCPTGHAVTTKGYNLPSKFVIHTTGPVWRGKSGSGGEAGHYRDEMVASLAQSYRNSLKEAANHGVTTIAFPCISTGVYGFPSRLAAKTALETVQSWLGQQSAQPGQGLKKVVFCVFDQQSYEVYQAVMPEVLATGES